MAMVVDEAFENIVTREVMPVSVIENDRRNFDTFNL
jgi:hypothetical protein